MLWPNASPLDLDFGHCAWAKLFNYFKEYGMEYACIRSYLKNFPNFDFSTSNYSQDTHETFQDNILPEIQCKYFK